MVKFGKKLLADQDPEWKGYYINYKLMKKKVKQYGQQLQQDEKDRIGMDFSKLLDDQIEKIVLFLLEQQGMLASRIRKLGKQRALPEEQLDISAINELPNAFREVGVDLIKLLKFVDLNATATAKILKKFDKRFGCSFTDYYVASRINHPYSQGVGAVLGALSRRLADLQECQGSYLSIYADIQECQGSYLSIYDQPCAALKDPIIDMINSLVDKVTCSTNFLRFLGQHALISDEIEESTSIAEEEGIEDQKYDFMSLMLNLVNTFLYMVNTYIIVPTADDYSVSLGAPSTVCGVVIGSMAVAQIFSSVYFSAWSNKSYFRPLVFSSIVLFLGNICYAMAYDMQSLTVLIIGRLLSGLGSARAVNRRYISDCVPARIRMQASAGFVSASALGMACGPALAGLLQWRFKIYIVTFNQLTLPGWFMAFAWLVYLVWLWILFKEPNRATEVNDTAQNPAFGQRVDIDQVENGLAKPLLEDSGSKQNIDGEVHDSGESAEDSRKAATSIGAAYRLLTPSVKVQLLIYFMLKYAMEILLSESSVITTHYFHWNTTSVAIFLAILGLTVLPINVIIGRYISNMFEDRQLLMASQITLLLGIISSFKVKSKYSVIQYVGSALVTFVSAEVLEGVNLSLLSSVMSPRLARGTYNGGLLSTEAGTFARVLADGTITAAGYLGIKRLLNVTLLPSLLICTLSIVCTLWTYKSLF